MRVVVYSDIHAPFQDDRAVELVNGFCRWYQPDIVLIAGDLIDFYAISKFDKSPARTTPEAISLEVRKAKEILKRIREANPTAEVTLIGGNHEMRLRKWLFRLLMDTPTLDTILGLAGFELDDLLARILELSDVGVRLVDLDPEMAKFADNYVQIGKVFIGHWDRVNKFGGYTAKNLVADKGVNIVQGHTHRVGSHFRRTLAGLVEAHEIGCLCELKSHYAPVQDWTHGFAAIEGTKGLARFTITPVAIKDYEFWFGGKHFKG